VATRCLSELIVQFFLCDYNIVGDYTDICKHVRRIRNYVEYQFIWRLTRFMYTKRKNWIDIVRGICIFLVVLGHIWQESSYDLFANQIKMPLFYVIAGLLVKTDRKPLIFVKKLMFRLGIPWILFSLIWVKCPYYIMQGNKTHMVDTLFDFLIGKSFWFIPSFFCSQILFYVLCKLTHESKTSLAVLALVCFLVAFFVKDNFVTRIWCIDTALSSVVFLFVGYCLKEQMEYIELVGHKWCLASVIAYLTACVASLMITPLPTVDFHNVKYGNLPINIFLISLGIVATICIGISLDKRFKLSGLKMIGRNTLVIYLLSPFLTSVIAKAFTPINLNIYTSFPCAIVAAYVICFIGGGISEICSRIMPWTVGLIRA